MANQNARGGGDKTSVKQRRVKAPGVQAGSGRRGGHRKRKGGSPDARQAR